MWSAVEILLSVCYLNTMSEAKRVEKQCVQSWIYAKKVVRNNWLESD